MDVVSEGELRARPEAAKVPGERVTFSGVGKTEREIKHLALDYGIFCFNVEIRAGAGAHVRRSLFRGARPAAGVSIRVPIPDVDARTHAKISTGKSENKLGVPRSRSPGRSMRGRKAFPGIKIAGVDMHIGSQITEIAPFDAPSSRLPISCAAAGRRPRHRAGRSRRRPRDAL